MEKNAVEYIKLYEESGLPKTHEEYFSWWKTNRDQYHVEKANKFLARKQTKK